ncbi:MAG: hypothetical protein F4Y44_11595 [Chloroflexi bacterium]|nr:hypothetical protein [Chloroflexota bacterium]
MSHIVPLTRARAALLAAAALAVFLLFAALAGDDAYAFGFPKDFDGSGSGNSVITNADECDSTGRCKIELVGEFDAGEMGVGMLQFRFTEDWADVSGERGSCSVPVEGSNSFTWETPDGDGLVMVQTLGFACPSDNGEFWQWKRWLRIVEGTGKFDGVQGTVFVSGRRVVATGEETLTFDGSLTFPREERDGCFRAYFIGDIIVIPPRDMPPPGQPSLKLWLCADDVRLQGPNPREGYEIFNPLDPTG